VELIVVAVVVVLVAAVAFLGLRRRSTDDVHSVEHYRQTLTTLQSVRTRSQGSGVRVIGGPESPPTGSAEGGNGGLETGTRYFEDPSVAGTASDRELRSSRRRQDRAIASMNRRPRRLAAPIASAVVVIAVVAALAVVGARQRHHATTTTTGSHVTNTLHATTTGAAGAAGGTTASTTPPSTHHRRGVTTTTTLPLRFAPQSPTATTATYVPPTDNYTLTVGATTANCWVSVTEQANGKVLFAGTLTAGQQQSVQASGVATIAIGAPSVVAVSLDQTPVVLPEGYQSPFVMTFQPSTAGPTAKTGATG